MKLTIESTTTIIEFRGVPTRIWRGTTPGGAEVVVFVATIAVPRDASPEEIDRFERELREIGVPADLPEQLRRL